MDYIWLIIVWAIFGLVAGGLAKAIMPGKDPGGTIVTILIGIGGAMVGGFIGSLFGISDGLPTGLWDAFTDISRWIFSIIGALIILFVWKKFLAPMFSKKD